MREKVQKMPKSVYSIGVVCLGVLVCFWWYYERRPDVFVFVNGQKVVVDIATTDDELRRGLGGQEALCETCGMLFVFDDKIPRSFWMKDMLFDIDIIWLTHDKIVHIEEKMDHNRGKQARAYSVHAVDRVLEVPAGFVQKNGVRVGQSVAYSFAAFE